MHDYSSLAFWERRYTNEHLEIFEWYQTFESLREKIIDYLKPEHKILNVGCGTSKFAEDLFYEGIKNVVNIDFSESAIRLLEEHFEEQQIVSKCVKMDVLDMKEFQDEEFNVVFDKALLDSVLCGENALDTVKNMMKEIYRVLVDEGYYIIVSNSDESTRKELFDENLWEYNFCEIGKPTKIIVIDEKDKDPKNFHYIYILKKKVDEEKRKAKLAKLEEEARKKEAEKANKKHKKKKKAGASNK
jgi:ubiquinone/menaquinone biosynthesis C-methylase UbiE